MNDNELTYSIEPKTTTRAHSEVWKNPQGEFFRMNGPARIIRFSDMNIREVWYQIPGMRHRVNGPAIIEYDEKGVIIYEKWYTNGINYNPNGPSFIIYRSNSSSRLKNLHGLDVILGITQKAVSIEKWTDKKGRLHREDGPAVIIYEPDETIKYQVSFLNGEKV